ncbi:hypothetical protein C5167_026849 [Papaver somniferum]|nr:hypothetical protein C5167_026849 [Papaver somniferum]
MDATTPVYSLDRYNEIVNKTSSLLEKVGFRPEQFTFVPMSGFGGDNLVEMSPNLGWFQGPTLIQALDQLAMLTRPAKKENPLRLPLVRVRMVDGVGTVAVGRVQSGSLKPGMAVNFAPFDVTQELTAEVKSVQRHKYHEATREALPGDIVGFNVSGIPWKMLERGLVASDSVDDRAWGASSFTALVSVLDHPGHISEGYTASLHLHTSHVPVTFVEIMRTVAMESSNVIKTIEKSPPFLQRKDVAEVRMVPMNPVVLESNSENPPLGRFAVRDLDLNNTVAVGIVRSVEKIIPTRQQKLEMELADVDAKIESLAAKIKEMI